MGQLRRVQTEGEFDALLQARQAILFFWLSYSGVARRAQLMFETWVQRQPPHVNVYRLEVQNQPYVARWLDLHKKLDRDLGCYGDVFYLRAGKIIGENDCPCDTSGMDWHDRYIRCVFGPPHSLSPSVRAWQNGCAIQLARAAYKHVPPSSIHLDPEGLSVLADALEEAGADTELLAHLRGPGPHWRACHILDLILNHS